jgi:hypothetical protein
VVEKVSVGGPFYSIKQNEEISMRNKVGKFFTIMMIFVVMLGFAPGGILQVQAISTNIVISQIYGGGGNAGATYKNDFIELYNLGSSTVSLNGWSVQYASATGTTWQVTNLTNVSLAPGQYYLVQEAAGAGGTVNLPAPDATGGINMSGTTGKVALVSSTTALTGACPTGGSIVDFIGFGTANCFEGAVAPAPSNTTADIRALAGCRETDANNTDFATGAPTPRNTASAFHYCTGPTNPSGVGAATPNSLFVGDATLLTVAVTPGANPPTTGHTVTCDLSAIGRSASQTFYDDGTNGDVTGGNNTFSYSTTIAGGTTAGAKSLACTIGDNESRPGSPTIGLTVLTILPIGTVNGTIGDGTDAATHNAAYLGQTVTIQGVIYEKTLQAISGSANTYKGFYIQNTSGTTDGDANTSDGLFVFMSTSSSFGGYTPTVGDEVIISGSISEYYNMTELTSPTYIRTVRSGVDLDAELPPVVTNPPVSQANANIYWERLQAMRVQIPADSIVLNGRNVFNPADAEIWVARSDSAIAGRLNLYQRRAFRDANPLDDNYDAFNWDGNGYRIVMGSLGLKAIANDAQVLLDPARTFATLTNAPVGGVNYSFSKYRIEVTTQPTFSDGIDPAANNPPATFDRNLAYSVVDYNLENVYDYRDNPFSGCDFIGNSGCPKVAPFLSAVSSPFDYVPASDAIYQARLNDIALQIINNLNNPDILMLQEVENQDICTVSAGALVCGSTDNADGKPDVLQELALKIAANGGPIYDAAWDRDSSDLRGIAPAFLYRTDRVQLVDPAGDPLLGATPAIVYAGAGVPANGDISNPKTLNAVLPGVPADGVCETSWVFPRAPDIALFRIYRASIGVGAARDVYVINNHFKSGPDTCKGHRTEQANYNAAIVSFLEAANPNARIIVGGDLNVYPRPDDIAYGASDQLASLYNPSLGLTNLWDVLAAQAPESAYSYVYLGMAQTLDQMFVNPAMLDDLQQFRAAHINSDFPADYTGDTARGTSDHDPQVAIFALPPLHTITPSAGANGSITPGTPQTVDHGDSASFNIAPDTGYHILDVLVDGVSQGAIASYTFNNITADHTISASFAIDTFTITPSAGANGSITPGTAQTVNYGDSATFNIAPDTGYHILDVLVDGVSQGAIASYTFNNVTADHTISASFAIDTFTITPSAGANGSIIPGTPQTVNYGDSATFNIVADTGYSITGVWVDGVSQGVIGSYTFNNVTADHTISATFADTTAPIITVPSNMTVEATSAAGRVVTFIATATDTVAPANPSVSCLPASGSTFALGTTTVNCSATDTAGNTGHNSFTIKVQDTTAPVLYLPADFSVPQTIPAGAVVTYSATATDTVGPANPVVTCSPVSGSTFPTGLTTVNCSAQDTAGNIANGSFDVTVTQGTQLLLNPGFDQFKILPKAWTYSVLNPPVLSLADCTVFFLSPNCSLKLIGQQLTRIVTQTISYSGLAGDRYSFGLSSRALNIPAGGSYKVEVSFFNRLNRVMATQTLNFTNGTHNFETVNGSLTVPAAYDRIVFRITLQKGSGVAWFDDAFLYLLP